MGADEKLFPIKDRNKQNHDEGKNRNGENEMGAYAEIKYFGETWLDQIINKWKPISLIFAD